MGGIHSEKDQIYKMDTTISSVLADGQRWSFPLIFSQHKTSIVYGNCILPKGFTHLGKQAPAPAVKEKLVPVSLIT